MRNVPGNAPDHRAVPFFPCLRLCPEETPPVPVSLHRPSFPGRRDFAASADCFGNPAGIGRTAAVHGLGLGAEVKADEKAAACPVRKNSPELG